MATYLYQRDGSNNWWLKLGTVRRSLGTADKIEAARIALPEIQEHQRKLSEKPRLVTTSEWKSDYTPGPHTINDVQVFATERDLFDMSGKRIGPNGGFARAMVIPGKFTLRKHVTAMLGDADRMLGVPVAVEPARPTVAAKNGDDEIFESYLKNGGLNHTGVKAKNLNECRAVWRLYKTLCVDASGKTIPLAKLKKDDARKIVRHLEAQKNPDGSPKNVSMTIRRKMTWLVAAVNHGVNESMLEVAVNPFSKISPNRGDAKKRVPLSPDDIAAIKANWHKLNDNDQLLITLLATSGMRLGEAFQVTRETAEQVKGKDASPVRCVRMGTKTDSSERCIPLPSVIAATLPRINGPLFKGDAEAASTRLNKFLHVTCGIEPEEGEKKDVHSLRHRFISDMEEIPEGIKYSRRITGHSERGAHAVYQHKSWTDLRSWMDKITF
jgi:integrase